jgi:hypothetical protein
MLFSATIAELRVDGVDSPVEISLGENKKMSSNVKREGRLSSMPQSIKWASVQV